MSNGNPCGHDWWRPFGICLTRVGEFADGTPIPWVFTCWGLQDSSSSWVSDCTRELPADGQLTCQNAAMTLGPRPYYWPNTREISYGNSPPIATRTGFLALACMPFLMYVRTLWSRFVTDRIQCLGGKGQSDHRIDSDLSRKAECLAQLGCLGYVRPCFNPHLPIHCLPRLERGLGSVVEGWWCLGYRRCGYYCSSLVDIHVHSLD